MPILVDVICDSRVAGLAGAVSVPGGGGNWRRAARRSDESGAGAPR
jgi:hypothetical protein